MPGSHSPFFNRFPFEHQFDLKDCGPACIKIISRYFGRYYSLQYLRELCSIGKEGVSFLDISHAAEKIGLRTISIKASISDIKNKVPLPCIVHWAQSHFVVVYKVTRNHVYVSDPAKGLIKYKQEEFAEQWFISGDMKGLLMAIEPQASFFQQGSVHKDGGKSFETIFGYFKPYRKSIGILMLTMLLITILQGILPFISKSVIDVGIQTYDLNFINIVLVANISIIVCITLSNMVRDWILMHLASRININLISDYLIKLMKLPVTFFENKLIGDILQRANDHERIRTFIMNNSLNLVFSVITFITFGIILLYYNPIIFLIFSVGSFLYAGWILLFLKLRKVIDWEYFDLIAKNQSYWVETVSGIQDIKINNYEKKKRWKWELIQAKLYKVNQRLLTITNTQNIGAQFINSLTNVLVVFYCAKAVISGSITFGVMISTQFIIGMLNGPIFQLISFIQSAQFAQISLQRLNEIHQLSDEDTDHAINNVALPIEKDLILRNVTFQYSRNSPIILKNINLLIPEGKVTAIVGDSGGGKSTLLKLLLRLYNPTHGDILIGKMNANNVSLRQWRNKCGAVLQDGKIFNDTIINNIVLDDDNVN